MAKTISYYTIAGLLLFSIGFGFTYSVCSLFNVGGSARAAAQSGRSMPMMRMR